MGKQPEDMELARYMKTIIENDDFGKAPIHLQLLIMLKALEETYREADQACFLLHYTSGLKEIEGLEHTHRFAQKTLLTQYALSLWKLVEPVSYEKGETEEPEKQRQNFSIPALLKMVYEQHQEIRDALPGNLKRPDFSYRTINLHKKQYRDLKPAIDALRLFRNKAVAHTDARYAFKPEMAHRDVVQWMTYADELFEFTWDILSFYFSLIHEEFSAVSPVAKELTTRFPQSDETNSSPNR